MKIVAIIPARYASTRFKGKPLAEILGQPMIQWVYNAAMKCDIIDQVFVATDHEEIARVVREFGGEARMTSAKHSTGTDRIAEVARDLDAQIVVNIQGDEPLLPPEAIQQALNPLLSDNNISLGTLKTRVTNVEEMLNPHTVKVVTDCNDYALYFSRSPIPYLKHKPNDLFCFRHIGLYVYRRDFLLTFSQLSPSPLEEIESLEQLRALEYGYKIKVPSTNYHPIGVDTPEDLKVVEKILMKQK
jgi:3-deoxy-manno-octulosonate cytidylyltransferase (CMP-KDO synthetase)